MKKPYKCGLRGEGRIWRFCILHKIRGFLYIADEIKKSLKCSDEEAAKLAEKQREGHPQNM